MPPSEKTFPDSASRPIAAPTGGRPDTGGPPRWARWGRLPGLGRRGGPLGAVALLMGGALSLQFGSAVAVLAFPRAGALGMVTLRLGVAAVVMLALCRPRLRGHTRAEWATVCGFGTVLAGMNTLFYQSIERIPVGTAVTLEVLGPLTLSVLTSRRRVSWLWAVLALGGVSLLGRGGFDRLDPWGVGFALAAGVAWAGYIMLSARTGRCFPRADGLAMAMVIAAVWTLPLGAMSAGAALLDPTTLALGAGVALMSSVLPYTLEMQALRRLTASTFAVLMSLEPAVAATAGFLVLGQALAAADVVAIALVIVASIGAVRSA